MQESEKFKGYSDGMQQGYIAGLCNALEIVEQVYEAVRGNKYLVYDLRSKSWCITTSDVPVKESGKTCFPMKGIDSSQGIMRVISLLYSRINFASRGAE